MDKEYWANYYKIHKVPGEPSPFAIATKNYIAKGKSLLELGCGNGRDAVYFANNGVNVIGLDQISEEISFLNKKYSNKHLKFICDDFTNIKAVDQKFDNIYSRFTLHAISEKQENYVIDWAFNHLNAGGLFHLEVRSVKDDLYKIGKTINGEKNARITTHYRRFAEFEDLKSKLINTGFVLVDAVEDKNFAIYKDENPVVIRIIAKYQ